MTSPTAPTVSSAQAAAVLGLHAGTIRKLRDTGLLLGPQHRRGTAIFASSLDTAASVLPTTRAPEDIVMHLAPLAPDPNQHNGRSHAGWHQEQSFALSQTARRQAWSGVWMITLANALTHVGAHAIADVGGFVVDLARVTGASACPCCGNTIFDLAEPDPAAIARYHGRRFPHIPPGSLFLR